MTVLITQRLIEDKDTSEWRDCLDVSWAKIFKLAQISFVPFPSGSSVEDFCTKLNVTGVILSGGGDVASISDTPLAKSRDKFEIELLERCISTKTPILGVCRGLQLICQYFGSELERIEGHVACTHQISINSEAPDALSSLNEVKEVNSYHEIGIKKVALPLKVAASAGSRIEAVYHESESVYGIMWHPERELGFDRSNVKLLRDIFL